MDLATLMQLSAVPATLVVLGGLLVLNLGVPEKASRRFLIYILGIAALTGLAALVGPRLWQTQPNPFELVLNALIQPVFVGIVSMAVLRLGQVRRLRRFYLGLAALALLVLIWLSAAVGGQYIVFFFGLGVGLLLAAIWAGGQRWNGLLGLLLVLDLLCLVLFADPVFSWLHPRIGASPLPAFLGMVAGVLSLSYPLLTVALAAVLVQRALKPVPPQNDPPAASPRKQGSRAFQLGLAGLILGGLAYTIFWASLWDVTSDGLSSIFLAPLGAMTGIGSGMLLASGSTGRRRAAGMLFIFLVPVLLFGSFNLGWQISYHAITEERAAAIAAALERYHARTGAYPQALAELVPADLLLLPQPVILRGEPWCYQGTPGAYRLGAVFREAFSSPLSIRIFASAGEPPASSWECDARLAALLPVYDANIYAQPNLPEEERLPLSEVPVPRQALVPLASGADLQPGEWSPDGRYLVFARDTNLQFLDVVQGQICPGNTEISQPPVVHDSIAWQADGRLLVVRAQGDLLLLTPCGGASEPPPAGAAAIFQKILAADLASGRMLLKAGESFWIWSEAGQVLKPVKSVTPNPYELHWDNAAWLPGGARLAISRLNGRDKSAGSTLYILDGQSGEIQLTLPQGSASDQSAPWVEWLAENELLLHGNGELVILDLAAKPVKATNVMQDLFGLDLAYPDEISSMASVVDRKGGGYYLALRANHPRNQSLYLYTSATRQVQVFEPQVHSLLFFPDGPAGELPKFELSPTYSDVYDLVWVGAAAPPRKITAAGHTPRSYPALHVKAAPGADRLYFSSSQGVSQVSISTGSMLAFWDLGGGDAYLTGPEFSAPNQRFVAVVDRVGLFIIPE